MAIRIAGYQWLFFLGLPAYAFASYRKPQLLLLLPFLGLGIASIKLGNRFAMFGGVALGAGFGFAVAELVRMAKFSSGLRWTSQLALCLLLYWPMAELLNDHLSPTPVLPKAYAQTFLRLQNSTDENARLWQWWDYGYAGQYYARRMTFGDGGAHSGEWLYALAKIHTTHSALQANQLMKYTTWMQRTTAQTPESELFYRADPVDALRRMGAKNATIFVQNLALETQTFPEDLPAQFFIVSWENLRIGYWISFYGNWDLTTGTASPGKIEELYGQVNVDTAQGLLLLPDQRQVPLDSLDVLQENNSTQNFAWGNGSGFHLLVNQQSRQFFLMDSKFYNSMMIQMLIGDPERFAPHFTLVDETFPWVRVYKAQ